MISQKHDEDLLGGENDKWRSGERSRCRKSNQENNQKGAGVRGTCFEREVDRSSLPGSIESGTARERKGHEMD